MGGSVGTGASITVARDRSPADEVGAPSAARHPFQEPDSILGSSAAPPPIRGPRDPRLAGATADAAHGTAARFPVRLWDDIGAYSPASLAGTVVAIAEDRSAR
jgi:hypothetical protein